MFVHTLAKFDDARRGLVCGCQIVDLRTHFESNARNLLCHEWYRFRRLFWNSALNISLSLVNSGGQGRARRPT